METQETLNSQSNTEGKKKKKMEPEESTCLTSDYAIKLQSLRQYGTGAKKEI